MTWCFYCKLCLHFTQWWSEWTTGFSGMKPNIFAAWAHRINLDLAANLQLQYPHYLGTTQQFTVSNAPRQIHRVTGLMTDPKKSILSLERYCHLKGPHVWWTKNIYSCNGRHHHKWLDRIKLPHWPIGSQMSFERLKKMLMPSCFMDNYQNTISFWFIVDTDLSSKWKKLFIP